MSIRHHLQRIIQFIGLFCISFVSRAQTAEPFPFASDIIKFDIITLRADKVIPFDKPFVLIIENINTENIIRASIYRVKSTQGSRQLFPDRQGVSYTDYVFEPKQMIIEKTKLTLFVPGLRPAMDFDILIEKKLSGRNLEKAHALDKLIVDNSLNPASAGFTWPANAIAAFKTLRDSANNNQFIPPRDVFTPSGPDQYYTDVFQKYETNYRNITADASYTKSNSSTFPYLTPYELTVIATQGTTNARPFNDAFLLEQIRQEGTFDDVLLGLRALGYAHGSKLTERDEFDKRVSNITSSIQLFDSLYRTMNEVAAKNTAHASVRNNVLLILQNLQANKKVMTDNIKAINTVLTNYKEAIWLIGTTESKDLQTKSSSIFTLDAGFANLWARDLNNKVAYIPKLYWGVNIYFRGTDKNLRSRYIPRKKKAGKVASAGDSIFCDYNVLSHKSPLTHFSLTIGFTFGSLDKQNFDNFFAGSSMLVGPSLRLSRSFRISAGAVFLKRGNLNPLLSDKRITMGSYASLSLDFDILNALKNVTNLFFK